MLHKKAFYISTRVEEGLIKAPVKKSVLQWAAHESGKSVKGKTRVSHVADKKLKALLSRGASSLIQYDKDTQVYLAGMIARGKHENLVRNNIKNKMLHTVCAVVKRGTPYIENYVSPYQQNVA